jgi:hypothetical protein
VVLDFYARIYKGETTKYLKSIKGLTKYLLDFTEDMPLQIVIHSRKYFSTITVDFHPDASPRWSVAEHLHDPLVVKKYNLPAAFRVLFETDDKLVLLQFLNDFFR